MGLRSWLHPKNEHPERKTDEQLEKEAVRQELSEIQARLKALSTEADVLARKTGDVADDV